MTRLRSRGQKGFTLAEVLGALAILIVLLMLLVPSIINLQRDLRQKELDAKAETIYVAAQNKLTAMRSSGYADEYQDKSAAGALIELPDDPCDREIVLDESGVPMDLPDLYAMNAKDRKTSGTVCSYVMTDDVMDGGLLSHYWVIEYEPDSGSVYAVYYSEDANFNLTDYGASTWSTYESLRTRDNRLQDGARVGYYGGDVAASSSDTSSLQPTITVSNKEKLEVSFFCARPITSSANDHLEFTVTLSDSFGHSYQTVYKYNDATNNLNRKNRSYYVTIPLDDLSSNDTRFDKLYGLSSGHGNDKCLVPGDVVNITLTVKSPDYRIEAKSVNATTNSLFADASNNGGKDPNGHNTEAVIEYGRHLQNLDMLSSSRLGSLNILQAKLAKNISFNETLTTDDWYHTYCKNGEQDKQYFNGRDASGRAKFKPIEPAALVLFEGNNTEKGGGLSIAGLNVEEGDSPAGLFAKLNGGLVLHNVTLTGARVSGSGDAGALAGTVEGTGNMINNCRVYLAAEDYRGKKSDDVWISGARTGGLVGSVSQATQVNPTDPKTVLTMADSFAATVVSGSSAAGGLVGANAGSLAVTTSYADCYVRGRAKTAGLVGDVADGAAVSLEDCYAAGFLYGASSYGLAGGAVASATNVYTVCAVDGTTLQYSTALSVGEPTKVYYLHGGTAEQGDVEGTTAMAGMGSADLLNNLGGTEGRFTSDTTSSSHPYNLGGQALVTYEYPRLKANDHYGDWEADFKSGSLVYYEKYASGEYGFFGANVSTITNSGTLVGDGYGLVYRDGDTLPETVIVTVEGYDALTFNPATSSDYYVSTADDGTKYRVYPLPRNMVNEVLTGASGFYWRVDIEERGLSTKKSAYYYNPHFAQTMREGSVDSTTKPTLSEDDWIVVRSARQLYNLSLYYDYYHDATRGCTFSQECDIAYRSYDWNGFYDSSVSGVIAVQEPIGGGAYSFDANYNGNCYWINDVSFVTSASNYVGMFGFNNGTLSNIVLRGDYGSNLLYQFVKRIRAIESNQYVYMGVLAGYNGEASDSGSGGVIVNCAASGYAMTDVWGSISAYSNGNLYVGGLIGANAGIVRNSASDCPAISISAFNAHVYAGGFVGYNEGSGSISDCYDLGHVEATYSRGGNVNLAGFAGYNQGDIRASYCATSLLASGETASTYGFAPRGGAVSTSRYLSDGTFEYLGNLHSYNAVKDLTSATASTREVLQGQRGTSWADEDHAYDYSSNYAPHVDGYPYRAVVKDGAGNWVHYGSWQGEVSMGSLGVFYWEREAGGSNDGYHFTYLGIDKNNPVGGTTLCTAHDDKGLIVEYGYGYFRKAGENVTASLSDDLDFSGSVVNEGAKESLQTQIGQQYEFFPYTTRVGDASSSSDYLYLSTSDRAVREGVIELTYGSNSYEFKVAPFFANAIQLEDGMTLVGTDGVASDYSAPAGGEDNKYQVRSLQQLQYLNWNCEKKNTTTYCGKDTYMDFPYLQYTNVLKQGEQKREDAYNTPGRSYQCWRQTHDLGVPEGETFDFTPIAASKSASSSDDWKVILYTWFGGEYDGGSYKIQNFDITSESFTVGLFGTAVGAKMHDIILYSDKGNVIKRENKESGGQVNKTSGAYCLGGLVGLAYDYKTKPSPSVISNCAIAGYTIVDGTTNMQRQGGATVGGLMGVANVQLERCSAVTDIAINCTHDTGSPKYGSYVRVGGLTGSAQYNVDNCYSGGTISVDPYTIDELYSDNRGTYVDKDKRKDFPVDRNNNVHIYIGGIAGSAYTSNFYNFTDSTSSFDGNGTFTNCYTYVKFPDKLRGTIKGISYIAGPADRYSNGAVITIDNCYHLGMMNEGIGFEPTDYYFTNPPGTAKNRKMNEDDFAKILKGDLSPNKELINKDPGNGHTVFKNPDTGPVEIDYATLSGDPATFLGDAAWGKVTVVDESGVRVDGKYSFPGNRPDLEGLNYPFPTVIKQGTEANVHYGAWPLNGASWSTGRDTLDIFGDMVMSGEDAGYAQKTFILRDPLHEVSGGTIDPETGFKIEPSGIAEVRKVTPIDDDNDGVPDSYGVDIRALREGAVTVTSLATDSKPKFVLEVTAKLDVKANPASLVNWSQGVSPMTLTATATVGNKADFSEKGTWTIDETQFVDVDLVPGSKNQWNVTHAGPGYDVLNGMFSYTYPNATADYRHTYEIRVNVPVKTYGVIGVSGDPAITYHDKSSEGSGDWEKGAVYNEVTRTRSATAPEAVSQRYTQDAPGVSDYSNVDFFLYESVSDLEAGGKALDGVTISSVQADPGSAAVAPSDFKIVVGEELSSDTHFQYRPCTIRYTGDAAIGKVRIDLSFTHAEDYVEATAGGAKTYTPYALSIYLDAPKYCATFYAEDGGAPVAYVKTSSTGDVVLPEALTREGYTFKGWLKEGAGEPLQPGVTVELDKDTKFVAAWEPIQYNVVFHANDGSDPETTKTMQCTYDEAIALEPNTFTHDPYIFDGWNTQADGSGTSYADKENVKNLTSEPNGKFYLYAVWRLERKLTLDAQADLTPGADPEPETKAYEVLNGTSVVPEYSKLTTRGYTLLGWFSDKTAGEMVLKADGTLVENVDGYTENGEFKLSGDTTLYAHWSTDKVKLIGNNEVFEYEVPTLFDPSLDPDNAYERPENDWVVDWQYNQDRVAYPYDLRYMLDGWYTDNSGAGGTMVIDADGNVVDESFFTGQSAGAERILYSRWTQSPHGNWTTDTKFQWEPKREQGGRWKSNGDSHRKGDKLRVYFPGSGSMNPPEEYVTVTMDLRGCAGHGNKQNLFSFGGGNIDRTNGNSTIHFLYSPSRSEGGTLLVRVYRKHVGPKEVTVQLNKPELKVELRKDSLKINGEVIDTDGYYQAIIRDQMAWNDSWDGRGTGPNDYAFNIGSMVESPSYATNYVVRVESETDDNHLFGEVEEAGDGA